MLNIPSLSDTPPFTKMVSFRERNITDAPVNAL